MSWHQRIHAFDSYVFSNPKTHLTSDVRYKQWFTSRSCSLLDRNTPAASPWPMPVRTIPAITIGHLLFYYYHYYYVHYHYYHDYLYIYIYIYVYGLCAIPPWLLTTLPSTKRHGVQAKRSHLYTSMRDAHENKCFFYVILLHGVLHHPGGRT